MLPSGCPRSRLGPRGGYSTIEKHQLSLRSAGGSRIMRDHHDRVTLPVQLVEEVEHSLAAFRVEVAGRFVGKDHRWLVGQRAGERHALLLASAHFMRLVVKPVAKPNPLQQGSGSLPLFHNRHASEVERDSGRSPEPSDTARG